MPAHGTRRASSAPSTPTRSSTSSSCSTPSTPCSSPTRPDRRADLGALRALVARPGSCSRCPPARWPTPSPAGPCSSSAPLVGAAGFALWVRSRRSGLSPPASCSGASRARWFRVARGARLQELDARGAGDYARVLGRSRTAGVRRGRARDALAAPVFAARRVPAPALPASRPGCSPPRRPAAARSDRQGRDRGRPRDDETGDVGDARVRHRARACARRGACRPARVLLVPAVTAVWGSLEEYTALLVRGAGVADRAGALVGARCSGAAPVSAACSPAAPRACPPPGLGSAGRRRRRAPGCRRGERPDRPGSSAWRPASARCSSPAWSSAPGCRTPSPARPGRPSRRWPRWPPSSSRCCLPGVRRPGRPARARPHLRPARPRVPARRGVGGEGRPGSAARRRGSRRRARMTP